MSASGRQNFVISQAEQDGDGFSTVGEPREFTYEYPFIDISSETRNVTHEPIDEDPIVQSLGPGAQEITIEGHCYILEANFIDGLASAGLVDVLSDRWSGYGIVKTAETRATGQGGGKEGTTADRLYEYRLVLAEVDDDIPDSVGPII